MHNVSLFQQQLREVAAILSANTCSNSNAGGSGWFPASSRESFDSICIKDTCNQGNLAALRVRHGAGLYWQRSDAASCEDVMQHQEQQADQLTKAAQ